MEQDNHIMIDLESLGLRQDAAIISIGAAKFDIEKGVVTSVFHQNIIWEDALRYGKAEQETVEWWSNQTGPAKESLDKPARRLLVDVFDDFEKWMESNPVVWGNGACFDIAKLERIYEGWNKPHPWFFQDTRDLRTINQFAKELVDYGIRDRAFVGTKHNAVDDAVNAALYVAEAHRKIKAAITIGLD